MKKDGKYFLMEKHPKEVKSDAKVLIKKDNKYLFIGASEIEINKINFQMEIKKHI